jgi:predicted DNA-binding transcriptional regulator AlpA
MKGIQFNPTPKKYRFRGAWLTVKEIAEITGYDRSTIYGLRDGDTVIDPATRPRKPRAVKTYWFGGEKLTLKEIGERTGKAHSVVFNRIMGDRVLTDDELKALPRNKGKTYFYAGQSLTLPQWASCLGVSVDLLYKRIELCRWPIKRALTEPVMGRRERNTFHHNRRIIRRIAAAMTGGSSPTSADPLGTGVGRHETDLEGTSP